MIKIAAIIIAAAFSTGLAVDVEEAPVEPPTIDQTVESPEDLAPEGEAMTFGGQEECLEDCADAYWICWQGCGPAPLCHVQCDIQLLDCRNDCYILPFEDE